MKKIIFIFINVILINLICLLSLFSQNSTDRCDDKEISSKIPKEMPYEENKKLLIDSILHSKLNSFKAIQPNYNKWNKIKKGMSYSDVVKILGKPIEKPLGNPDIDSPYYGLEAIYGIVVKKSKVIPENLCFEILFLGGKVDKKVNPFNCPVLSKNGIPTVPKMIYPLNNTTFSEDHFPQIVDFRFFPASGEYPMGYLLEVDSYNIFFEKWNPILWSSSIPYFAVSLNGGHIYRWRIKAVNKLGESHWSKYRYFNFKQTLNAESRRFIRIMKKAAKEEMKSQNSEEPSTSTPRK